MTTPMVLSKADLRKLDHGLRGRLTLVLQGGQEITGAQIMDHFKVLQAQVEAMGTSEGNDLRFKLAKKLAVKAIQEQRMRDPENCWVQDMERHLLAVTTVAELDTLLRDEHEDDWLEGYVLARMEELVDEITAPFSLTSHNSPATGKE